MLAILQHKKKYKEALKVLKIQNWAEEMFFHTISNPFIIIIIQIIMEIQLLI